MEQILLDDPRSPFYNVKLYPAIGCQVCRGLTHRRCEKCGLGLCQLKIEGMDLCESPDGCPNCNSQRLRMIFTRSFAIDAEEAYAKIINKDVWDMTWFERQQAWLIAVIERLKEKAGE